MKGRSDGLQFLQLKPELSLLLACARAGKAQEKQAAIEQLLADGIDWTSFAQKALRSMGSQASQRIRSRAWRQTASPATFWMRFTP